MGHRRRLGGGVPFRSALLCPIVALGATIAARIACITALLILSEMSAAGGSCAGVRAQLRSGRCVGELGLIGIAAALALRARCCRAFLRWCDAMSKKFLDLARLSRPMSAPLHLAGSALVLVSVFILGLIVLCFTRERPRPHLRLPLPRYQIQLQLNSSCGHGAVPRRGKRQLNGAGWVDKAKSRCAHPHSGCDAQNRAGKYSGLARGGGAARRAQECSCFARAIQAAP